MIRWLCLVLFALLVLWTGVYAVLRQGPKWRFGANGVQTAAVLGGGPLEQAVDRAFAPLVWAELRLRSF